MMPQPTFALVLPRLRSSLVRFRDDESGAMALYMLMIFFLTMVFGGIAVDYMRFEIRRVALQQTMDRAALAAANLENTRPAQDVVDDYWDKARLGEGLDMAEYSTPIVTVVEGQNNSSKQVTIRADVTSKNYFMGMGFMPVDYLQGPAGTKAVQGASQVEVMLVLDITGSMDSRLPNDTRKKITGLIDAATLFVNEVKDIDDRNQVSIGIVPYNTQVNLGAPLRAKFAATNLPTVGGVANSNVPNVNCLEPPTTVAAFGATAISTADPIPISVHADMVGGTNTSGGYVAWNNTSNATLTPWNTLAGPENYMCAGNAFSEVLLPTMNKTAMLNKISSLKPGGRTSIMMGMRWGVALIDETARPIYADLRSGEASMVGRPANNNNADTRKIIVLMTDGEHVATSIMRDPYKSGISPIYRSDADNNFSIFHDRTGTSQDYWVPHLSSWQTQPWTNAANTGTFRQLDWSEVWQAVRISWVAQQLYARPGIRTYSAQMNLFRNGTYVDVATMNARLQTNCAAAKASGIEVYGIAFGAGTSGEAQIRGCASAKGSDPNDKTGYYFKPQTSNELAVVFRDIASQVSKLRLTQ
jgi:Flp pilus assembly protein TadG